MARGEMIELKKWNLKQQENLGEMKNLDEKLQCEIKKILREFSEYVGWVVLQIIILALSTIVGVVGCAIDFLVQGVNFEPLVGGSLGAMVFWFLSVHSLRLIKGNPLKMACIVVALFTLILQQFVKYLAHL